MGIDTESGFDTWSSVDTQFNIQNKKNSRNIILFNDALNRKFILALTKRNIPF